MKEKLKGFTKVLSKLVLLGQAGYFSWRFWITYWAWANMPIGQQTPWGNTIIEIQGALLTIDWIISIIVAICW